MNPDVTVIARLFAPLPDAGARLAALVKAYALPPWQAQEFADAVEKESGEVR